MPSLDCGDAQRAQSGTHIARRNRRTVASGSRWGGNWKEESGGILDPCTRFNKTSPFAAAACRSAPCKPFLLFGLRLIELDFRHSASETHEVGLLLHRGAAGSDMLRCSSFLVTFYPCEASFPHRRESGKCLSGGSCRTPVCAGMTAARRSSGKAFSFLHLWAVLYEFTRWSSGFRLCCRSLKAVFQQAFSFGTVPLSDAASRDSSTGSPRDDGGVPMRLRLQEGRSASRARLPVSGRHVGVGKGSLPFHRATTRRHTNSLVFTTADFLSAAVSVCKFFREDTRCLNHQFALVQKNALRMTRIRNDQLSTGCFRGGVSANPKPLIVSRARLHSRQRFAGQVIRPLCLSFTYQESGYAC